MVGNLTSPSTDGRSTTTTTRFVATNEPCDQGRSPIENALEGVIESFEMAFRMQGELPKLLDLSQETATTFRTMASSSGNRRIGRQCLFARRFAEAGVRFIEITHEDWDHHGFVSANMPRRAQEIDRPIAALLRISPNAVCWRNPGRMGWRVRPHPRRSDPGWSRP